MLRLEYRILIAFGLDLICGDPVWLPHPVKGIGRFAAFLEECCRKVIRNQRFAGIITSFCVILTVALAVFVLLYVAGRFHPIAEDIVSILILYSTIAVRDLARHSRNVFEALKTGDLQESRNQVSKIVGRDTDKLNEQGIIRAAVESVSESIVDGITAPLFFAALAGPVGAMVYKAINTMDSMFGYKNEKYMKFGWASARLDDIANYIPARLTAPMIPIGAALTGLHPIRSLCILFRDGGKTPSPNAGLAEAAVAGALGVQLGGLNYYLGKPSKKPKIGEMLNGLDKTHILTANRLMMVTTMLALALFLACRLWVCGRCFFK